MYNYLYLIQDNRDIGSNIYKIGKTTQAPSERFKGYEKGTYPIRISHVDNCHQRECELINLFKKRYKLSRGREYFIGILNNMILDFTNYCDSIINKKIIIKESILNNNAINYIMFECELCNAEYKNKRSLDIHLNRKNKCNVKTAFQCLDCKKYFKQNKNLQEHIVKQICKINEEIKKQYINVVENKTEQAIKSILQSSINIESKIILLKNHDIILNDNSIKLILESDMDINGKLLNIISFINNSKESSNINNGTIN
jgi:hypothetical protein